jgi:hypothetical protein
MRLGLRRRREDSNYARPSEAAEPHGVSRQRR